MSWTQYWNSEMRSVEETEDIIERAWTVALAAIVALERSLRRRITGRALRLDLSDRRQIKRFRAFVHG